MKWATLALLAAILAGCGSSSDPIAGGSVSEPISPPKGDLSDLNGLPLEEFLRALVPRLAREPGIQSPAKLAAALDQKWKINCEQTCRIERK